MFIGRHSQFSTKAVFEDNAWTVVMTLEQGRSSDLKDWEKKDIGVKVTENDLDNAVAKCNFSINSYLQSVQYDLFTEEDKQKELNDQTGSESVTST